MAKNTKNTGVELEATSSTVETETVKKKETAVATKTDTLQDDDSIEVYSNMMNLSYYDKSTGLTTTWSEVGDMVYMTFGELKNMNRLAPNYLKKLYIYTLDKRVNDYFHTTTSVDSFNKLFEIDLNKVENFMEWKEKYAELTKRNASLKSIIFSRLSSLINNGELTNIQSIRILENVYRINGVLTK